MTSIITRAARETILLACSTHGVQGFSDSGCATLRLAEARQIQTHVLHTVADVRQCTPFQAPRPLYGRKKASHRIDAVGISVKDDIALGRPELKAVHGTVNCKHSSEELDVVQIPGVGDLRRAAKEGEVIHLEDGHAQAQHVPELFAGQSTRCGLRIIPSMLRTMFLNSLPDNPRDAHHSVDARPPSSDNAIPKDNGVTGHRIHTRHEYQ